MGSAGMDNGLNRPQTAGPANVRTERRSGPFGGKRSPGRRRVNGKGTGSADCCFYTTKAGSH